MSQLSTVYRLGFPLLLLGAVLLAGCGARPIIDAPAPLRVQQEAALRDLGFNQVEDGWLMVIAEPISFDFNASTLHESLRQSLFNGTARDLLDVEIREVRFEGHTDDQGAYEYNAMLSLARSQAVADVFIAAGFRTEDVTVVGLSSDFPVASNDTREGRASNRRVDVIIPAQALAQD